MRIEEIARKLRNIVLRMATSGCNCAGECGGCGSHANPLAVEPAHEREGSESKEAIR